MKKILIATTLVGTFLLVTQPANAWNCNCQRNQQPQISYATPYVNEGKQEPTFSLNPFTGFKNCNPCKIKKQKCCKQETQPCQECKRAYVKEIPCPCNK